MDVKTKHKLKKFIKELDAIRGRHTELVSVYLPAGYDLNKAISHLYEEQGTASNIKDARTRKNVQDSLEKCIRSLKLYKRLPEKGLAVFAGNASKDESKINIQVWMLEPPEPINTRLYRCDQTFMTDILKAQMEYKEAYGLIVMDRKEATIGLLKGPRIDVLKSMTSGVPGKFRAGGQCHDPKTQIQINKKETIILEEIKVGSKLLSYDFEKEELISSYIIDKWIVEKDTLFEIKTKNSLIKCSGDHLLFIKIQDKVEEMPAEEIKLGNLLLRINDNLQIEEAKVTEINKKEGKFRLIDISVKNQNFIANGIISHNSAQRFHRLIEGMALEFYRKVAEVVKLEFLPKLKDIKGILIGGPGHTKNDFADELNQQLKDKIVAIQDITYTDESGLHHLVEKSKDILAAEAVTEEKEIVTKFLTLLAKEASKAVYGEEKVKEAIQLGAVETLLLSEKLQDEKLDELEQLAGNYGAEVRIISVDTREGEQLRDLSGIAAILRYPIS
ncbi:MAG: hypothetical protein Q8R00_02725 [Candidatus Nanoarchaeia archaeon]|nr:hypothetical protein [Candidatus Nanoarchaeia archaeon]